MNTAPNVFTPAKLGPVTLRNRIIKAATFEASTPDALVTDDLINSMDRAMTEGFDFVAMGRALLAEPDLINRIKADSTVRSACTHCNQCMPTIYSHTHCVMTGAPDALVTPAGIN
jgi:2,4-dienoyl-CoA reductase-like NADH-dependent reductase (Old Yellow Enzyme family)